MLLRSVQGNNGSANILVHRETHGVHITAESRIRRVKRAAVGIAVQHVQLSGQNMLEAGLVGFGPALPVVSNCTVGV